MPTATAQRAQKYAVNQETIGRHRRGDSAHAEINVASMIMRYHRLRSLPNRRVEPEPDRWHSRVPAVAAHGQGFTLRANRNDASIRFGPIQYSKRIFQTTVSLPNRRAEKTKPAKRKTRVTKPKRPKKPVKTPTPSEIQERREKRRQYDKNRDQRPERKQYVRERGKNNRQRAKELGLCRTCSQPAIPNQTRCPSCAAKHRLGNATITAKRRAARNKDQQTGTNRNPSP